MRDTTAATKSGADPFLAAPSKTAPTPAAVLSRRERVAGSPRAHVAYSLLFTLNWFRDKLRQIFSHDADRWTGQALPDVSALREKDKLTQGARAISS